MKLNVMSTITSLLAILFMTLHGVDDVLRDVRGMAQGGVETLVFALILIVWLYGVLLLAERRSGYVINLVGSLLWSFLAVGHMTGVGGDVVLGEIATSSGAFFVWTVIALGVTAIFSFILSARGLWSLQRSQSK